MTRPPRTGAGDWDVLVAGAGPAGAATAARCAAAGLRTLLVDSRRFPRDKVCGDFLGPLAVAELRALGVTGLTGPGGANPIREAGVSLDGELLTTSVLPVPRGRPLSRVVPRQVLDARIVARAAAAGARVEEGTRVVGLVRDRDGVDVALQSGTAGRARTVRSRVIVGADGSTSLVARTLPGGTQRADDRIIAVRAYYEGVAGPADRAELAFSGDVLPGYCWLFPTGPATANVGLGMVRQTVPPAEEHLRDLLARMLRSDAVLRERLGGARPRTAVAGWPLATYNAGAPLAADRLLLVGDAAGLINPLNGEGIQYALLSARWAAAALARCAAAGDFSAAALRPYAARVGAELGADFSVARLIVQLIRNRSLNPLWVEGLRTVVARAAADPAYARLTGGVLAGVVPARRLLGPGVLLKTAAAAAARAGLMTLRGVPLDVGAALRLGADATGAAVRMAGPMVDNPDGSRRWGHDLVTGVLGLRENSGPRPRRRV